MINKNNNPFLKLNLSRLIERSIIHDDKQPRLIFKPVLQCYRKSLWERICRHHDKSLLLNCSHNKVLLVSNRIQSLIELSKHITKPEVTQNTFIQICYALAESLLLWKKELDAICCSNDLTYKKYIKHSQFIQALQVQIVIITSQIFQKFVLYANMVSYQQLGQCLGMMRKLYLPVKENQIASKAYMNAVALQFRLINNDLTKTQPQVLQTFGQEAKPENTILISIEQSFRKLTHQLNQLEKWVKQYLNDKSKAQMKNQAQTCIDKRQEAKQFLDKDKTITKTKATLFSIQSH